MIFEIEADLIYSRPRLTRNRGKLRVIEEVITVKPSYDKSRFALHPEIIVALESQIHDPLELFHIDKLGYVIAAAFNNSSYEGKWGSAADVREKITDEPGEWANDLWYESAAITAWNNEFDEASKDFNLNIDRKKCFKQGYDGVTYIEPFDEFLSLYISDVYGQVIDCWFQDLHGKSITTDTDVYRDFGFYECGEWCKENYRLKGFCNIKKIYIVDDDDPDKIQPATIDKVLSCARKEAQNMAYDAGINLFEHIQSLDIEFFKNWHSARLEYFQESINRYGKSSPHLRKTSRDFGQKFKWFRQKSIRIFYEVKSRFPIIFEFIEGAFYGALIAIIYFQIKNIMF